MTKKIKVLLGLVLSAVLLDTWLYYFYIPGWEPMFASTSPDGRFTVTGYYNCGVPFPLMLHPRSLATTPVTLVLRDVKTGKVLKRVNTKEGGGLSKGSVRWYPEYNEVGIVSVGDWNLPPE